MMTIYKLLKTKRFQIFIFLGASAFVTSIITFACSPTLFEKNESSTVAQEQVQPTPSPSESLTQTSPTLTPTPSLPEESAPSPTPTLVEESSTPCTDIQVTPNVVNFSTTNPSPQRVEVRGLPLGCHDSVGSGFSPGNYGIFVSSPSDQQAITWNWDTILFVKLDWIRVEYINKSGFVSPTINVNLNILVDKNLGASRNGSVKILAYYYYPAGNPLKLFYKNISIIQ